MKFYKFFMGVGTVAALSLASCSSDEPNPVGPDTPGDGESVAYMMVTLADVNASGSRATAGDFVIGEPSEREVQDANFYFYTAEGIYVTSATVWAGGEATTPGSSDQDNNIEFKGKTVLVLKGLDEAKAPKYIVTVLNKPAGFTPGQTLGEMEKKLATLDNEKCYLSGDKFIMTTSSYEHNATPENTYEYFTTSVTSDAFLKYEEGKTPSSEDIENLEPVVIYVERLAAKVGVTVSLAGDNVETVGGDVYAKITISMGNTTNTDQDNTIGGYKVADKDLYVKIEGWGLSNIPMNEMLMKNLVFGETQSDDSNDCFNWTNIVGNNWNDASCSRSYWAKAWTYGKNSFTANSEMMYYALKDVVNKESATVPNGYTLDGEEITAADFLLHDGDNAYTPENTNKASILVNNDNLGRITTNAMIYARIYNKDDDGSFAPASMVRFNGIMFDDDDFVALVLNSVQKSEVPGAVRYAYKTTEGEGDNQTVTFHGLSISDVRLTKVADGATNKGQVTVALTTAAKDYEWYTYTGEMTQNADAFTPSTGDAVNTSLNNVISNIGSAYCYNGGYMYYNRPIEHFGPGTADNYKEGFYGVVRNHKYQLTINSVSELGNAIFDPEQVIIPDNPSKEHRYALGVQINVLSWKLVNQTVDL